MTPDAGVGMKLKRMRWTVAILIVITISISILSQLSITNLQKNLESTKTQVTLAMVVEIEKYQEVTVLVVNMKVQMIQIRC